jgi:hypothetical protein
MTKTSSDMAQILRERGARYVVDANNRPVAVLLTPEEYQHYLDLVAHTRQGVPGRQLLRFAGAIPPDDLDLMRQAIEADCEQVDTHEW